MIIETNGSVPGLQKAGAYERPVLPKVASALLVGKLTLHPPGKPSPVSLVSASLSAHNLWNRRLLKMIFTFVQRVIRRDKQADTPCVYPFPLLGLIIDCVFDDYWPAIVRGRCCA